MSGAGSLVDLDQLSQMQNKDGRLILTAEVTKTNMAKTTKIYLNKFVSIYFSCLSHFIFYHFRRYDQSVVYILNVLLYN